MDKTEGLSKRQIRVRLRDEHTIEEDLNGCVACLKRADISAHFRKPEIGNGIVVLDDVSDKERALKLLRDAGYSIVADER
ncbi:MAG: hypothetical protein WCD12_16870 [Candidatus Binatus sp.]|uniref:hypothetical protein n=1 Tax=Candidatus Binatus sp. TaxID=2811406 RepID=UPI003C711A02